MRSMYSVGSERSISVAKGDGTPQFRVPLFARWLVDEGVREIVVTMGDDDALIRRQRAEEAARPKSRGAYRARGSVAHLRRPSS